jgi:aristolochene synthase
MRQFQRTQIWKRAASGPKFGVPGLTNHTIVSRHTYPANKPTRKYSTILNTPCEIPACQLESKSHPKGWEKIQAQVEPYFGKNWNFASKKEKRGFLDIGFSRAFSHFFPLTLDGRIETTCKMHYLALLIDGWFLCRIFENGHY